MEVRALPVEIPSVPPVRARLRLLGIVALLPFALILARLYSLQLIPQAHVEFLRQARRTAMYPVPPRRGRILDRHGRVLAENHSTLGLTAYLAELHPRYAALAAIHDELEVLADVDYSLADMDARLRELAGGTGGLPGPTSPADVPGGEDPPLLLVSEIPEAVAARIERLLREERSSAFELTRESQGASLWFRPREALRLERVLGRLALHLEGESEVELSRRVEERLRLVEERVRRAVARHAVTDGIAPAGEAMEARETARRVRRDWLRRGWSLARDVSLEAVTDVEYHPERYPGIRVEASRERRYPPGAASGSLVGYLRPLNEGEIEELEASSSLIDKFPHLKSPGAFAVLREGGLRGDDLVGATGLEKAYDAELRGRHGMQVVLKGRSHQPLETIAHVSADDGADLVTTLDLELQRLLHDALREACRPRGEAAAGSVAVMDLSPGSRGALLASAGYPGFDPNRMRGAEYERQQAELEGRHAEHGGGWYLHRPQQQALFPGSVFKLVTAVAALESGHASEGPVSAERLYACTGEFALHPRLRCNSAHGPVDLVRAVEYSCNSYFYHLGARHLEPRALWQWARAFGFGRETGIDLPPSRLARGRLHQPADVRGMAICHFAIGQVYVEATPLQVLRVVAALALRCESLPRPYLVRPRGAAALPPVRPEAVAALWEGMERAVHDPGGTAAKERYGLYRFRLAAKTGTAQYGDPSRHHAWMAGFAPLPEPRIAFVVVLEKSQHGGGDGCAPLARRILEYFARQDPGSYLGAGEALDPPGGAR